MANLTLSIPDAAVPRIGAAFRSAYDPESTLTDAQLVKRELVGFLKRTVAEQERNAIVHDGNQQMTAAGEANDADVEAITIG